MELINTDIYNMKLHEHIDINEGCSIMRVPNGWNYIYDNGVQFVEFNSEFEFINKIENIIPNRVICCVRDFFKLPNDFIKSKSKKGNIPIAKKFIMKFLYDNLDMTHENIASHLYLKRSMVTRSIPVINEMLYKQRNLNEQYKIIYKELNKIH